MMLAGGGLSAGLSVDNGGGSISGQTELQLSMLQNANVTRIQNLSGINMSPEPINVQHQGHKSSMVMKNKGQPQSTLVSKSKSKNLQQQKFKLVNSSHSVNQPTPQQITQNSSKVNSRGSSITTKAQRSYIKNSSNVNTTKSGQSAVGVNINRQSGMRRSTQLQSQAQKNSNTSSQNPTKTSQPSVARGAQQVQQQQAEEQQPINDVDQPEVNLQALMLE